LLTGKNKHSTTLCRRRQLTEESDPEVCFLWKQRDKRLSIIRIPVSKLTGYKTLLRKRSKNTFAYVAITFDYHTTKIASWFSGGYLYNMGITDISVKAEN